ncbi:MAG: glycoside hydrolase family 57 protein [Pseudomonadota bacterium]|nr:glycoside hydrolase family 57 protein [Pseudomonadota bacterium]
MSSKSVSSEKAPLNVVLMWHMHQPEYRDLATGEYRLPWTYLHAIKDYTDMAAHLERYPGARAVVNFAPILLEQLEDYAGRVERHLGSGEPLGDRLLSALAGAEGDFRQNAGRKWLIDACLKANEEHAIKRYPAFDELAKIARQYRDAPSLMYLNRQFFADLMVWYHLAWLGEAAKRKNPKVRRLLKKQRHYTLRNRHTLLQLIGDEIRGIVPRYRKLAEQGRVELAMSPYAHPMLPLLIDFQSMQEAMPGAPMPETAGYPDGEARACWHLEEGAKVFERLFGTRPQGCWPSEGGLSVATAGMLAGQGFRWTASGDNVLRNSIHQEHPGEQRDCQHQLYRYDSADLGLFFRDDGLSDLIGFTYSNWHADDAVGDLLHHLHNIGEHCESPGDSIVSIILDGENAWEYYPENGYYFLDGLYRRLSSDPSIRLTTYGEFLNRNGSKSRSLSQLVAGSWVYGTFSTWIGDLAKNRAWDLLCDAKTALDEWLESHPDSRDDPEILKQLAVCEGSDWFWWFGDYNPAGSVRDFDELYRRNLRNLYTLIGQGAPAALDEPLSMGGDVSAEAGGVMRRGG